MLLPEIKSDLVFLASELHRAGHNFKKHSTKITELVQGVLDDTQPATLLSQCKIQVFEQVTANDLLGSKTAKRALKTFHKKYLRQDFLTANILCDIKTKLSKWYSGDTALRTTIGRMSRDSTPPTEIFQFCREQLFNRINPATLEEWSYQNYMLREFLLKYPEADTSLPLGTHTVSKLLLCAQSQTIRDMMQVITDTSTPIFEQNDVTEAFYNFILTGNLMPMSLETFLGLIEFAHKNNCTALEKACCNECPKRIDSLTDKKQILNIWENAKLHDLGWLQVRLLELLRFSPDRVPDQLKNQVHLFSESPKCLSAADGCVTARIFGPEEKAAVLALEIPCSELNIITTLSTDEFIAISKFSTLVSVTAYGLVRGDPDLIEHVKQLKSIRSLRLLDCSNFQLIAPAIKQLLVENPSLENFEFNICTKDTPPDLCNVIEALHNNTALRTLRIVANIDSKTAQLLSSALEKNTTLKVVDLRKSVMSQDSARKLFLADPKRVRVNLDDLSQHTLGS